MLELTREEYNLIAERRGIKKPQNMSTKKLINILNRYDSKRKGKKLLKIGLWKVPKITNISENEVNKTESLQRKSINEIARLRRIKNRDKLTKEGLIISLLKSESSDAERNYMKHFNNNTNDDTYDDKIRGKISDIRMILSRLGNIVTNKDRKKITKELYEIEKKENLSDKEKEKIYDDLVELVKTLDKKEKYKYHDRDDLDYHGIRDIENLFDNVNDNDYYKPILVKSSFKNNYKYYESRGDKDKKLSVKQYLYKIMPYLSHLINDHKATRNESKEWKIQINMHLNVVSSKGTGETRTIFEWSDNEEIRSGNETDDIIKGLLNSFLNNYQKEEIVLRNGSDFVFESVDLLSCHIQKNKPEKRKIIHEISWMGSK